jgi:hypothetical protein
MTTYNMSINCFNGREIISANFRNKIFPRRNSPDDENIIIPGTVQVKIPGKSATFSWSYYVRLRSR